MPHNLHFVEDHGIAVISYRGSITAREIETVFESLLTLARERPGLAAIGDFRRCTLDFTAQELRSLATFGDKAAAAAGPSRWAILAADDLTFGLGRMYSAFAADQPVETQTFRELSDVADWLGVDEPIVAGWLETAAEGVAGAGREASG